MTLKRLRKVALGPLGDNAMDLNNDTIGKYILGNLIEM